jgi:aspartate kinase
MRDFYRAIAEVKRYPGLSKDSLISRLTLRFAKKFKVPFEVRSSFNTHRRTIVREETPGLENVVVRGVSVERNQAKVTITNVPDLPGLASRIFTALAEANVVVDVIVQNVSSAAQPTSPLP